MTDGDEDAALARWRERAAHSAGRAYAAAYGREIADESRGMRWDISPRVAITAVGALALAALLAFAVLRPAPEMGPVAEPVATPEAGSGSTAGATAAGPTSDAANVGPGAASTDIVVFVSGQVVRPGLVELSAGERVADAIDLAGGALADADLAAINLARVPGDGEQIDVPAIGEDADAAGAEGAPVRLNQASVDELDALPGVGPVTAQAIVDDRDENGPFASLDDLERVSGIGPALVADLEGQATP